MGQDKVFKPDNLRVLVQKKNRTVAEVAKRAGIPELQFRRYLNGQEIPTLRDAVALHWYFDEPIEVVIGLQELETYEMRLAAATERTRTENLRRMRITTPIDIGAWPQKYHEELRAVSMPNGPRNRLLSAGFDKLGYVVVIAQAGKLSEVRGVGRVGVGQILDMLRNVLGEDYSEQNPT